MTSEKRTESSGNKSQNKRLRLNDDQRRRLAAKAKTLGRRLLREVATIVTPETLQSEFPERSGGGSGRAAC